MPPRRSRMFVPLTLLFFLTACINTQRQIRSNALHFLYPELAPGAAPGQAPALAGDVTLKLPVRVGIAFPPSAMHEPFTENQKQELLGRVAEAFRGKQGIASVEVIPSTYLQARGGFANLDAIARGFGIDLMGLVSYDQFQFSESGRSSWAYWTLVGAYLVRGEKNETRTMLEAAVYDIPSRAMLFHAGGQSSVKGKTTLAEAQRKLRLDSEEGFSLATGDLIVHLDEALKKFQEQAATGTVRGAGTPSIEMFDESGRRVQPGAPGAGGAGAFALWETGAILLAGCLAWAASRRCST